MRHVSCRRSYCNWVQRSETVLCFGILRQLLASESSVFNLGFFASKLGQYRPIYFANVAKGWILLPSSENILGRNCPTFNADKKTLIWSTYTHFTTRTYSKMDIILWFAKHLYLHALQTMHTHTFCNSSIYPTVFGVQSYVAIPWRTFLILHYVVKNSKRDSKIFWRKCPEL